MADLTAYFTVEELRAAYADLANETRYPDAKLEADRVFAEQWFETASKVAYIPRTVTETLTGNGRTTLFLTARAEVGQPSAVTIDGAALIVDELAEIVTRTYGALYRAAAWPAGAEIVVTYKHGHAAPVELAKQAVMMLTAEKALPSTVPARATAINTDIGSYRISQADKTGKTGIPDVDAIIGLLGDDGPVVG